MGQQTEELYGCKYRTVCNTAQNCNKLEQVQRLSARFACCKYERTASVTSMLNDLKWESLQTRRNCQRLTMFYRMQHNMVSIIPAEYLVPVQPSRSRSDASSPLRADIDIFKHSFFSATVRMWNSLPVTVIQSHSIQSFKTGISARRQH